MSHASYQACTAADPADAPAGHHQKTSLLLVCYFSSTHEGAHVSNKEYCCSGTLCKLDACLPEL